MSHLRLLNRGGAGLRQSLVPLRSGWRGVPRTPPARRLTPLRRIRRPRRTVLRLAAFVVTGWPVSIRHLTAFVAAITISLVDNIARAQSCDSCASYRDAVAWGTVSVNPLSEASGLAASARNLGVLWTHNDGSRRRLFGISTNGALLANLNFNREVSDVEAIAVGPGPVSGASYIYIGDIGGSGGTNTARQQVRVLRAPEPEVDLAVAGDPITGDLAGVETFTLVYPDASHDAEAMMVDPLTTDLFIITKEISARVYRVNLNSAVSGASVDMELIQTVGFANVSAADISPDGSRIIFRREDFAMAWSRCAGEPLAAALGRSGQSVPVVGPPVEPNGEGITFLRDTPGYATLSEGENPSLYFFEALCPAAPRFIVPVSDRSGFVGGSLTFTAAAVGVPSPAYQWQFNGQVLPGENGSSLVISQITAAAAGLYQLVASNASGVVTDSAMLTVRPRPDLRITEVLSSTAPSPDVPTADWWELTSFESQPVDLGGWRFNDNSGGLADPFVLPAGLTISPGETIVFVEDLTPVQFRNWWGASNLPPALQIVSYSGAGLSLGAAGDGIRLWNNTTADPADLVASVDFGSAQNGVSFNYDPVTGQFGAPSRPGVNGVVSAAASPGDVGSPGRILAPIASPVLQAQKAGERLRIEFDAAVGRRYHLEATDGLELPSWANTGQQIQATNNARIFFEADMTAQQRFFRVRVE